MNYPALIKSYSGKIYHITDDGCKTRCGRRIDALPESHALNIDESERCQKCGIGADYGVVNQTRADEELAAKEARDKQFAQIQATNEARSVARPGLVDEVIMKLAHLFNADIYQKAYANMHELRIPVLWHGEYFTIKVQIWNGIKE